MHAIHKLTANTTVNALVDELYDVRVAPTGSIDVDRRDGAARALRALNPSLPADETTVTPGAVPFVRLRRIPRSPFRLPAETSTMRDQLASIGIRNISQAVRMRTVYLRNRFTPALNQATLERLQGIANLQRLTGMDRATAIFLGDHPTTPVRTIQELAAKTGAQLKALVQAHVTAGFPSALLDEEPWNCWRLHARRLSAPQSSRVDVAPTPVAVADLAKAADSWSETARSPRRTGAERASASAIAWAFGIARDLSEANVALRRGKSQRAYRGYKRVVEAIGARAAELGLIAGNSPELQGPSLETVLGIAWRTLDAIEETDRRDARKALGAPLSRPWEAMRSFTLADLNTTPEATVTTQLDTKPASALGATAYRQLQATLSERTPQGLAGPLAPLAAGIATPNATARFADLADDDHAQVGQNLKVFSLGTLRANDAPAWATVRASGTLRGMRAAVGTSLDVGGVTPNATSVLLSGVSSQYPTVFTNDLKAFDGFVSWRPSRKLSFDTAYLPLNSSFAVRYRLDLLKPLLEQGGTAALDVRALDFSDPARFLILLPALYARQLPMAMARSLRDGGKGARASAMAAGGIVQASALSSPVNGPFSDAIDAGEVTLCSGTLSSDPEHIYEQMLPFVAGADRNYQAGLYPAAQMGYDFALALVALLPAGSAAKEFLNGADDALADVADRAQVGDPTLTAFAFYEYTVEDPADSTIVQYPLFGRVVLTKPRPLRSELTLVATENLFARTTAARGDVFDAYGGFPTNGSEEEDELDVAPDLTAPTLDEAWGWQPQLPELGSLRSPAVFDDDPLLALTVHAYTYRAQLKQGLNWLGFDPDTVPVWRYDTLLAQARYFGEKADEIQQRGLSVLTQAETAAIEELSSILTAATAAASLAVAKAQVEYAQAEVDAANAAKDAVYHQANMTEDDAGWATVGAVAAVTAAVVVSVATFGTATPLAVGALVAAGAAAGVSGVASIDQAVEANAAATDQKAVAYAQAEAASKGYAVATAQYAVANQELASAEAMVSALFAQATNSANLFALLDYVAAISGCYLRMANRMAWLAERAYQFETRRSSEFVRQAYGAEATLQDRFSSAALLLADLDAVEHARVTATRDRYQLVKFTYSFLASDPAQLHLLREKGACLLNLTARKLDERFPGMFLHGMRRLEVEVDGLLPASGVTGVLRTTANTLVRVPNSAAYVDSYELVDTDWAYPDADYPMESTTTPPKYVMKPLLSAGFSQVLSEYRQREDGGVLSPPPGALDTFEHLGVTGLWSLELPRSANAFDFHSISDVRFVIYFTAHYDGELRSRQEEVLAEETVSRAVLLTGTGHSAESFDRFIAEPGNSGQRDMRILTFDVGSSDLPANISSTDRFLSDLTVAVVAADGDEKELTFRLRCSQSGKVARASGVTGSATVVYGDTASNPKLDGCAYSAVQDTTVTVGTDTYHEARTGHFPALAAYVETMDATPISPNTPKDITGTWSIKVLAEDNPGLRALGPDGEVQTEANGRLVLASTSGAAGTCNAGTWTNVAVSCDVNLGGARTVTLVARQTGSNRVYATLNGITTSLNADVGGTPGTAVSMTGYVVENDVWTRAELRVFGTTAELWLDGVRVLAKDALAVTAAGSVAIEHAGTGTNSSYVESVTISELDSLGVDHATVLVEEFADGSNWTLATGATVGTTTHDVLDLAYIKDMLLQLDFTGKIDFQSLGS